METDAERYAGRPLLKLVEAWCLDAIGVLDDGTAGQLQTLAPRIAAALGLEAHLDWRELVTTALRMPPAAAHATRALWAELESDAILAGQAPPDAAAFARALADSRFGALTR